MSTEANFGLTKYAEMKFPEPDSKSSPSNQARSPQHMRTGRVAAEALEEIFLMDMGTTSIGITGCRRDPVTGAIYYSTLKEECKRGQKPAKEYFAEIEKMISKYNGKKIAIRTSWSRELNTQDDKTLNALTEQWNERPDMVVNTVTIDEEDRLSDIAGEHNLFHKNKDNPSIANVMYENTRSSQAGGGSVECKGLKLEIGARWVEKQLSTPKTLKEIYKELRVIIMNAWQKDYDEKPHLLLQGLLAIAISDTEIMNSLGLTQAEEEDWKRGQILKPLDQILKALHERVSVIDRQYKMNPAAEQTKARNTSAPIVFTLAFLDAFADKFDVANDEQLIMNGKEPMLLNSFEEDENGKRVQRTAKVTNSLGLAIAYFQDLQEFRRLMPKHVTVHT